METLTVLSALSVRSLAAAAVLIAGGAIAFGQAPPNDDFDDAVIVTVLPFSHAVDTRDATTAADDPDACFWLGPTVWYSYTATQDIFLDANTFESDYDTILGVFTGQRGSLIAIACNDDAGGSFQSRVRFEAEAGETYYFMVGAFGNGDGGNLVFSLGEAGPLPIPLAIDLQVHSSGSFDRAGNATLRGTVTCSRPSEVSLFGHIRQDVGRFFTVQGWGSSWVVCEGQANWELTVASETGKFGGGPAKVEVNASAYDFETGDFAWDYQAGAVRLGGGQGKKGATAMAHDEHPGQLGLQGNYPNPFNPQTTIRFSLPEATPVRLAVYDALGRRVRVLVDGTLSAGDHQASFDARDLPSGIYFSRLEAGGQTFNNRMLLIK